MTHLRVCVDARLRSGQSGGVEQFIIGLAAALSKLEDGDEEYLFLGHPDHDDWLRRHLHNGSRVVHSRMEYPGQDGFLRVARRALRDRMRLPARLPRSDGVVEGEGVDLVHFATQEAFLTELPSIYQPHDLQHLHLPEMFSDAEVRRRERVYRTHCERAELVVAMTAWGRDDLIEHYGLAPEKVAVVPEASVLSVYPEPTERDLDEVRLRLGLPRRFLLYPAQSWPHKNHENLLRALALIRDRSGTEIPVVCPGRQHRFFSHLAERARALGVADTTYFPGFIPPLELRCLYELASGLVFPSRFEGWGLPLCEAFEAGLPVACSAIPSLEEVAGDAALTFDPEAPEEIADRILVLWTDEGVRSDLIARGRARGELFTFERSARLFRAHYRRIGGARASAEDRILLGAQTAAAT